MSAEANPNPFPSSATDPGGNEAVAVGATDQDGDGAGPNGAVQQANGAIPDLPPPNAAGKQPLVRRLFRRQNRVHNTYEAQTAKYGLGGNVSEPTAPPTTDEQPVEGRNGLPLQRSLSVKESAAQPGVSIREMCSVQTDSN
ncbi:unnamed protein product [Angiostrongylus costaricensis]|uniref:Uncharacterized protein n=1 Tax=Angiostrongylus costaricensis TaxID=334426 RepID=A0A0R3PGG9_ANGCS|nr:unnamed protein product [Angiostrongylus costaricensis]